MKCSSCGTELPAGYDKCPVCGAPLQAAEESFADDFGFASLTEKTAPVPPIEEDVKAYVPRHLHPQAGPEADESAEPPEYEEPPRYTDEGPSPEEVDRFISQMDIAYEEEPYRSGGGAARVMWPVALAVALLALIIALILLFRSCSGPGTGPVSTAAPDSSATPDAVVTTGPNAGGPGSMNETTPAPEDVPVSLLSELNGMSIRMEQGASQKLDGGNVQIYWHTSDDSVVTVDGYGVITAVGAGNATIMAVSGEEEARIAISVYETEYSEWLEELPAGISSEEYDIESVLFYRFREKELTTSTESSLAGWTLYSSDIAAGSYGEWSDWQTEPVTGSVTREVQSVTQYSYRTVTEPEKYGDWSGWGEWTADRRAASATLGEETRNTYRYYYYTCPKCGIRSPLPKCYEWGCGTEIGADGLTELWSETPQNKVSRYVWDSGNRYTGDRKFHRTVINGSSYFFEEGNEAENVRAEYRYRSRSFIPAKWSSWSTWQTEPPAANASTEVQERTLYRYRDMSTQKLNYFERWGEWSEPVQYVEGQTALVSTDRVEYELVTLYRFREK